MFPFFPIHGQNNFWERYGNSDERNLSQNEFISTYIFPILLPIYSNNTKILAVIQLMIFPSWY